MSAMVRNMIDHLATLETNGQNGTRINGKDLLARATGRFYTHELVGRHLVRAVIEAASWERESSWRIVEPFCGDGRLICWWLEAMSPYKQRNRSPLSIDIWDSDGSALRDAKERILAAACRAGVKVRLNVVEGDTFALAREHFGHFQVCMTNPPWENLKPDRRELEMLDETTAADHVRFLRQRDAILSRLYPVSQPLRKFSGWGTNLARCGAEVALRLTAPGGVCGIVSPASLLADQMSEPLRDWIFQEHQVHDIAYYAAEARLFEYVDQASMTLVASPGAPTNHPPRISVYDRHRRMTTAPLSQKDWGELARAGYAFPSQFGLGLTGLLSKWRAFPRFQDLEGSERDSLWAGRELDETGYQRFLLNTGKYLFIKGRMIERFGIVEMPHQYVREDGPRVPKSADYHRIAWRDVSRQNQKRRMHATIIPPGWVTGNSLHVAYYRDNNLDRLKALLGVMSSLVFECQVRAHLATGHISLGVVRRAGMPHLAEGQVIRELAALVDRCLGGEMTALTELEVTVAQLYGLSKEEFVQVVSSFEKLEEDEREALLSHRAWTRGGKDQRDQRREKDRDRKPLCAAAERAGSDDSTSGAARGKLEECSGVGSFSKARADS